MRRESSPLKTGAAVLAALVLALTGTAGARGQRVSTGLKGGLISATVVGADASNARAAQAFTGGAFLTLGAGRLVGLRAEVLFSRKSATWSLTEQRNRVRLDYIEVPLLVKLSAFIPGASAQPHLLAGPELAFRIRCRVEAPEQGVPFSAPCDQVDGARFTASDPGLVLGGGFDFPLGRARLTLDARYVMGLTNVIQDVANDRVRTRTFAAMLGVAVPVVK